MRVLAVQPFVQPFRATEEHAHARTGHPSLVVRKIDGHKTHVKVI